MIALPSRSGRNASQILLLLQPCDPVFQVVVGRAQQGGRLAPVAGGAVRADELVQPRQQRPGVGDIAPHRRIGPLALAVAVETQVQEDQPRHILGELLRVLQRAQPLAHHLRADHLVVVEAHPAARLDCAGRRLADVVQQRGPAQHQIRVVLLLESIAWRSTVSECA